MEKAGGMMKNEKIEDKGRAKRDQAAYGDSQGGSGYGGQGDSGYGGGQGDSYGSSRNDRNDNY